MTSCVFDVSINQWCFFFNRTASKLYSLWHVGYLLDDLYGFHVLSRVNLLLYNPASRPDSAEPPRLLGLMPSYRSDLVVDSHLLLPSLGSCILVYSAYILYPSSRRAVYDEAALDEHQSVCCCGSSGTASLDSHVSGSDSSILMSEGTEIGRGGPFCSRSS